MFPNNFTNKSQEIIQLSAQIAVQNGQPQKEYQKYIEKDAALERRFQPILVAEPSEDDAIAILRGIKKI